MSENRLIEEFEKLSVKELQEICKRFELSYSNLKKSEIVQIVVNYLLFIISSGQCNQTMVSSLPSYRIVFKSVLRRLILNPVQRLPNIILPLKPLDGIVHSTINRFGLIVTALKYLFGRLPSIVSLFGGFFAMYQLWMQLYGPEKFVVIKNY